MIFNIQRFSLHDGDGIRTVVFIKGCPLRCSWCSNPESQGFAPELFFDPAKCIGCRDCLSVAGEKEITWENGPQINRRCDRPSNYAAVAAICPAEAMTLAGEERSADEILALVERDKVFYRNGGGLTLSGGEPFARPDFAAELLALGKKRGLTTGVETCLAVPWPNIEKCLPFLDSVYADVKHVDADKYHSATGGDLRVALDNLRRLAAGAVPIAARVPVVPGFNSSPTELETIVRHICSLEMIRRTHLMPYHNYGENKYRLLGRKYPMAGVPSVRPEDLIETAQRLSRQYGLEIIVGG